MKSVLLASTGAVRYGTGDLGLYSTHELLDVLYAPQINPAAKGFWMPFFPREYNSQSERIMFDDIDLNERRLAPFVAPNVQGRIMSARGYETRSFKPAYVKPKHVVDPARAIPRRAGERQGGELTLQQRYDAIVVDNMRREREMIDNRLDWMGCQVITTGKCLVVGEDYPARTVDFRRDPALTATLTGAARWSEPTAAPMTDIALMRATAHRLSSTSINRLIFGQNAWAAFVQDNHPDTKRLLDNQVRGGLSEFNTANLSNGQGAEYQGFIQGGAGGARLDLWVYSNTYEDYDRQMVDYMDPGLVVGVGNEFAGAQCFAAILDKRAALRSLRYFPSMWDTHDPSMTYTMTQSAPLMVPGRIDNTFAIKVV